MLLGNILLALAWTALQGELTLTNLVIGYVLGYGVLRLLAQGGVIPRRYVGRVGSFLHLVAYLAWELVHANIRLTMDVLRPAHTIRPGVIGVPLDATSDGEILMLATLVNFTPGSTAIDVSEDRKTMFVHLMHIDETPDASRRAIKEGFERRVICLFEPRNTETPMPEAPHLAMLILAVSASLAAVRVLVGPTLPDRVVATDLFGTICVGVLTVGAAAAGQRAFLDAAIIIALVAFVGNIAYARFIERK